MQSKPKSSKSKRSTDLAAFGDANKENPPKPIMIAVEGNIGSGKTTFLQYFENHPQIQVLLEPVEKWKCIQGFNSLDLMYKDARRWCMAFQSFVMLTMLENHQADLVREKSRRVRMIERSIYSARHCFVENLHQSGVMPELEFAVISDWHEWIQRNSFAQLDLIVYLRASPVTCHKRIAVRNRQEEKEVPLGYLEKLHMLHEEWLVDGKRGSLPAPVLILDADVDLSTLQKKIKRIEPKILVGQVS